MRTSNSPRARGESGHRKKTLRSFYCEEELWKALEKMSLNSNHTINVLINDALIGLLDDQDSGRAVQNTTGERPRVTASLGRNASAGPGFSGPNQPTLQRMPAIGGPSQRLGGPTPPPMPAAVPPPPPTSRPQRNSTGSNAAIADQSNLFVHFDGRSHPMKNERFVIGRGTAGTDLTIRDGNISRKHAAVILHSGKYYIKDLGSTNGIEYKGNRIETKRIEEGDIVHICDYELTFSFKS